YGLDIEDGDIIVITSKILSVALGRLYDLNSVKPSFLARLLSRFFKEDARVIELILREGEPIGVIPVLKIERLLHLFERYSVSNEQRRKALARAPYLFLVKTKYLILTDAGLDFSNVPPGYCTLPPKDPDEVAKEIMLEIQRRTGRKVAVIITDTEFEISRFGSRDIAIGCVGITPVSKKFGAPDLYKKPKFGGVDLIADAIASMAGLLFGQTAESTPVVIIKGLNIPRSHEGIKDVSYLRINRAMIRVILFLILLETLKLKLLLSLARLFGKYK
ncbi:hypothetical protein DRN86_04520, partial [Candidatus Geothermarchaeota archaeon]